MSEPTLTPDERARYRRDAEAATDGPWETLSTAAGNVWVYVKHSPIAEPIRSLSRLFRIRCDEDDHPWYGDDRRWKQKEADARHIANMDPPTTIALFDDLDRLEAALRHIRDDIGATDAASELAIQIARAALPPADEEKGEDS